MLLEAWLTLAVIVVALTLFITEVVTVDLAALIVMSLLLVLGLVSPEEGISGFANPATITVLAMFVLSAGVERTGAVNLLAQKVAKVAGASEVALLTVVLAIVLVVSAFINNTAAVAIMIPLVVGIARDRGLAASRFLMPLSFGSMLGGLVTLVGTSTNILASSISADLGHGAFGMFEFAAPAGVLAVVGGAYLLTVGRWLTPRRDPGADERFDVGSYLGEVAVPEGSPVAGRTLAALNLTDRYGVEVVQVLRAGETREPRGRMVLLAGDELLLLGERRKLLEVASLEGLVFKHEPGTRRRGGDRLQFYEVVVTPQSRLIGHTVEDARFRSLFGGTVVAVRKGLRVLHTHRPIVGTHLDAGDALLVAGTEDDRACCRASDDLLLVEELGGRAYRREKLPLALAIFGGVVATAAVGLAPILVTSLAGAALMAVTGVLSMDELHRSIRWDILFLLAGVIPLGIAMAQSGLADALAAAIVSIGADLPPVVVLGVLFAGSTLLTSVMSNNATAVLLVPVAASTAVSLGMNPKTFILAVAFGASTCFLTPVGYQTNAMIYGPGGYRFTDYLRVGLPLTLVLLVVAPLALAWFIPP